MIVSEVCWWFVSASFCVLRSFCLLLCWGLVLCPVGVVTILNSWSFWFPSFIGFRGMMLLGVAFGVVVAGILDMVLKFNSGWAWNGVFSRFSITTVGHPINFVWVFVGGCTEVFVCGVCIRDAIWAMGCYFRAFWVDLGLCWLVLLLRLPAGFWVVASYLFCLRIVIVNLYVVFVTLIV